MKKREPVKQKENVIFFPDLDKRLTEKGLESLHSKRYKEEISLLEDARDLDPDNGDILIGLVLAYFEGSSFKKAKNLAKEMLLQGIGDYLQMVDLYLTILIQLHEYGEIVATIEALLDEKEIPSEKKEHFLTILQFSRRMAENSLSLGEESEHSECLQEENEMTELNLHSIKDPKDQMLLISSLADKNIRPYINEIKTFLDDSMGNPFLKTMLLNLLKEQEYDKEISVEKFNNHHVFIPDQLPEIGSQIEMVEIKNLLKRRLENSDPVLFENIKSLVERHFFIIYPLKLEPGDIKAWAAAFHMVVLEYYGEEPRIDDFSMEYGAEVSKIAQALDHIREVEEISYPVI
jgi:tetratricopeptide (TPR) repeat protein